MYAASPAQPHSTLNNAGHVQDTGVEHSRRPTDEATSIGCTVFLTLPVPPAVEVRFEFGDRG